MSDTEETSTKKKKNYAQRGLKQPQKIIKKKPEEEEAEDKKEKKKEKYLGGRKLRAQLRKELRKDRVVKASALRRVQSTQPKLEMVIWFQQRIEPECTPPNEKQSFSYKEACDIVAEFIQIFVDERNDLQEEQRKKAKLPGRHVQKSASLLKSEMNLTRKINENNRLFATSGIEAPDITDPAVVLELLEFNGRATHLQNIKFTRFSKNIPEKTL